MRNGRPARDFFRKAKYSGVKALARPGLKVGRPAGVAVMAHLGSLRLAVLKRGLALRAYALWLRMSGPAHQFDVAYSSVVAQMPGNGEIVNSADGG
jgi:hypothetical protein